MDGETHFRGEESKVIANETGEIDTRALPAGTRIRLQMKNGTTLSAYEIVLLNPQNGEVTIVGGKNFTRPKDPLLKEPEEAVLKGSEGASHLLSLGIIRKGERLEFVVGKSAIFSTGEVESIEIVLP